LLMLPRLIWTFAMAHMLTAESAHCKWLFVVVPELR
jgi:hypothetical protein